jgi:hypothetical protein
VIPQRGWRCSNGKKPASRVAQGFFWAYRGVRLNLRKTCQRLTKRRPRILPVSGLFIVIIVAARSTTHCNFQPFRKLPGHSYSIRCTPACALNRTCKGQLADSTARFFCNQSIDHIPILRKTPIAVSDCFLRYCKVPSAQTTINNLKSPFLSPARPQTAKLWLHQSPQAPPESHAIPLVQFLALSKTARLKFHLSRKHVILWLHQSPQVPSASHAIPLPAVFGTIKNCHTQVPSASPMWTIFCGTPLKPGLKPALEVG